MRKALCIGINNYPGTQADLSGCVNDAKDWAGFLRMQDFTVETLLDKYATKQDIVRGIKNLLKSLKTGEVGFLTYSGHGTWLPDLDGDEPDNKDEAWCPYDWQNLLLDDELSDLFHSKPANTRLVVISDSCHSGTVYRMAGSQSKKKKKIRFLPPGMLIKETESLYRAYEVGVRPRRKRQAPLKGLVHFSGCADNEFSADAFFGRRASGAMTYFLLKAFIAQGGGATPSQLFNQVRQSLPSWDYPQTPQLFCEASLMNKPLLR